MSVGSHKGQTKIPVSLKRELQEYNKMTQGTQLSLFFVCLCVFVLFAFYWYLLKSRNYPSIEAGTWEDD